MPNVLPKPDLIVSLEELKPRFVTRAGLIAAVRDYFRQCDFLETETPLLIPAPAPEEYIEAPSVGSAFLRTSPELQMKCLLVAGYERIFQLGPCFREGEYGRRHRPEFTMLEWYQAHTDYLGLAEFTRNLMIETATRINGRTTIKRQGRDIDFAAPWQYLTVRDAYRRYAGIEPETALADDSFDQLMVEKIEPQLGWGAPTILLDYPAERASLSRRKSSDPTVAERWELYLGGLEIANAYSELLDPAEQRQRFALSAAARANYGAKAYPEPEEFFAALEYGLPPCAGCALGIDRLVMVMTEADDIADVTFPSPRP